MGVTHLLDYGCGAACNLAKHIKVSQGLTYQAYDPGVEKFASPPVPAQMVACIDVLEHVEPELVDNVLDDITRLTEGVAFLTICTKAALKNLPDGRNAHLTQQPLKWWIPKICERFDVQTVQQVSPESFFVVATSKFALESADGGMLSAN